MSGTSLKRAHNGPNMSDALKPSMRMKSAPGRAKIRNGVGETPKNKSKHVTAMKLCAKIIAFRSATRPATSPSDKGAFCSKVVLSITDEQASVTSVESSCQVNNPAAT